MTKRLFIDGLLNTTKKYIKHVVENVRLLSRNTREGKNVNGYIIDILHKNFDMQVPDYANLRIIDSCAELRYMRRSHVVAGRTRLLRPTTPVIDAAMSHGQILLLPRLR